MKNSLRFLCVLAPLQQRFIVAMVILFACGNLPAQNSGETLVPLPSNPIQMQEALQDANARTAYSIQSLSDTIPFPNNGLMDNFSYDSHRPDTSLWDLSTISNTLQQPGVYINRTWATCPNDLGVCTFDGLDLTGRAYNYAAGNSSTGLCDILESRFIDLSARSVADSVYLSFFYQPKGRGYAPNAQDSLILQFDVPSWNPNQSIRNWKTIWFKEGYTPAVADSGFHCVTIKLDSASYFVKGFKFRFLNYATQCGSNDHWHIDDVYMKVNRTFDDTLWQHVDFVYPASSALTDYWAVPIMHFKPTMMASNFNVQIANHDTSSFGRSATYWYDVLDSNGNQVPNSYYHGITGVPTTIPPYDQSGYLNYSQISHADITGWAYAQGTQLTDSATYRIRHIISSSFDLDTMVQLQKFYNYYAYDDGTAEVGYGLIGTYSQLAYKFTMPIGVDDTLRAVQMYFLPVFNDSDLQNRDWQLTVWSDGAGQPGTVLYRQRNQHIRYAYESPDRFITYTLDSGLVPLSQGQTYYIGWIQSAADVMYLGFDYNTDHHDKIYYNSTGNWYTSVFNGSLMMRPVFGEVYPHGNDESGIAENGVQVDFDLYPNPANDNVYIGGLKEGEKYSVRIFDISGREVAPKQGVMNGAAIDVAAIAEGMYFVQVMNEKGVVIGTKRLIISE